VVTRIVTGAGIAIMLLTLLGGGPFMLSLPALAINGGACFALAVMTKSRARNRASLTIVILAAAALLFLAVAFYAAPLRGQGAGIALLIAPLLFAGLAMAAYFLVMLSEYITRSRSEK